MHVNKIAMLLHVAMPQQENAGSSDGTLTDLGLAPQGITFE